MVAWNRTERATNGTGELQTAGFDLEVAYRTDRTRISFSHNVTKQLDFDLLRDAAIHSISASPYGYGNDLANWSNHVSRCAIAYELNEQWSTFASATVYWGYPDGHDFADYHEEVLGGTANLPLYADGMERAPGERLCQSGT